MLTPKCILILTYCDAVCVDKWVAINLDLSFAPSSISTMLGVVDQDFTRQTAITKCEYLMSTNATLLKVPVQW